jgi:outer membrane biosynthesis protein TonB
MEEKRIFECGIQVTIDEEGRVDVSPLETGDAIKRKASPTDARMLLAQGALVMDLDTLGRTVAAAIRKGSQEAAFDAIALGAVREAGRAR